MESILEMVVASSATEVNRMYGAVDSGVTATTSASVAAGNGAASNSGNAATHHTNAVWTALAIFQALSPLSKQYVMRLLFIDIAIPLEQWVNNSSSGSTSVHAASIQELASLRMIEESAEHNATLINNFSHYRLNPHFKRSLQHAVMFPAEPWRPPVRPLEPVQPGADGAHPTEKRPPTTMIEENFDIRWDNLMRLLVGAPTLSFNLSQTYRDAEFNVPIKVEEFGSPLETMRNFLLVAKLATEDMDMLGYKVLKITSRGYEFMLKDILSQVWSYMQACLARVRADKSDMLALLFMLSFCRYGDGYNINSLSKRQIDWIFEMSFFGLVFIRSQRSKKFYPSRAVIDVLFRKSLIISNLTGGGIKAPGYAKDISQLWGESTVRSSLSTGSLGSSNYSSVSKSASAMTIVVETNNQVVAYIHNDLHFAMLSLFVDVFLRTPNMVMGRITRDKAKAAYKIGLSSQQIIDFLCAHAHPVTTNNEFVVPENVCDLLKVWENETCRLNCTECVLFMLSDIRGLTVQHYNQIIEHMQRLGVLLWCLESKRLVAVTPAGASQLQAYAQEVLGLSYVF
jgi:hypothetical protein